LIEDPKVVDLMKSLNDLLLKKLAK